MSRYEYRLDPTYTIDSITKNCVEQTSENKHHMFLVRNALGNTKVVSAQDLEVAATYSSSQQDAWICDLTKMDSFIHKINGSIYGNGQQITNEYNKSNISILDEGIIRMWDAHLDTSAAKNAAYPDLLTAIIDFNRTGCSTYYNMYKCNSTSSEVKKNGCPEWNPTSWNKLYTTPAGTCSRNEKCATGTFKSGYNRGTSWKYTYFWGDTNPKNYDPDKNGHGYLTIDYCNAAKDWIDTDNSGYLIFKTINPNTATWCKHSGYPNQQNWLCASGCTGDDGKPAPCMAAPDDDGPNDPIGGDCKQADGYPDMCEKLGYEWHYPSTRPINPPKTRTDVYEVYRCEVSYNNCIAGQRCWPAIGPNSSWGKG